MKDASFADLKGKTITEIIGLEIGKDEVEIVTKEGNRYLMNHQQDCCESVYIDDIEGDVADLIGSEITLAEESNPDLPTTQEWAESYTWTFYRLATVKGYVTIKWYGSSNGYYSESVSFEQYEY